MWEGQSLLNALRDDLDLPGSKNACEQGECGSCSVYLDGTLVCSCLVLAAAGRRPQRRPRSRASPTASDLHAVQQAMVDAGAVQCGFCTPGLRRREPRPAGAQPAPDRARDPRGAGRQPVPLHGLREDHRRGPARARRAAIGAERGMSAPTLPRAATSSAPAGSARPPRASTPCPKVRGEFEYSSDMHVDGMLWGATLRSPHPRARHLVDRHRARRVAMPGRARRAHPRGRARPQDLRDGDRRPARAGLEDDPLPGRGDRDRRRRRSRDRAPRRAGDQGRLRGAARR